MDSFSYPYETTCEKQQQNFRHRLCQLKEPPMSWIQGYCDHFLSSGERTDFSSMLIDCYLTLRSPAVKCLFSQCVLFFFFCLLFLLGFVFDVESMAECPTRITVLLSISVCVSCMYLKQRSLDYRGTWKRGRLNSYG